MRKLKRNNEATQAIRDREDFFNRSGSLWGAWLHRLPTMGEAPDSVREAMAEAWEGGGRQSIFVVFSYRTPIAWATEGDALLTVPRVRYSNTTSRHQSLAQGGIMGEWPSRVEYVTVGESVTLGDPGAFRKGKGATPFGARVGW